MKQHRIYLGRVIPGTDLEQAAHHWWYGHSLVVPDFPYIKGYVQNRLVESWWSRVSYFTCAETWFDSREDEQAGYASDYYSDVIIPDERQIIGEEGAWTSAVLETEVILDGARTSTRVLNFGGDTPENTPEGAARVEVLRLQKNVPDGGPPSILSVWTSDAQTAEQIAASMTGLTFVSHPSAVVVPDPAWSHLRHMPLEEE